LLLCADPGLFDIFSLPSRFTPSHKTKTHANKMIIAMGTVMGVMMGVMMVVMLVLL